VYQEISAKSRLC